MKPMQALKYMMLLPLLLAVVSACSALYSPENMHYESGGNDYGHMSFDLRDDGHFAIVCNLLASQDAPASRIEFFGHYEEQWNSYVLRFEPYYMQDGAREKVTAHSIQFLFNPGQVATESDQPQHVTLPKALMEPAGRYQALPLFICNTGMQHVHAQ